MPISLRTSTDVFTRRLCVRILTRKSSFLEFELRGGTETFESEARHLIDWCAERGLKVEQHIIELKLSTRQVLSWEVE